MHRSELRGHRRLPIVITEQRCRDLALIWLLLVPVGLLTIFVIVPSGWHGSLRLSIGRLGVVPATGLVMWWIRRRAVRIASHELDHPSHGAASGFAAGIGTLWSITAIATGLGFERILGAGGDAWFLDWGFGLFLVLALLMLLVPYWVMFGRVWARELRRHERRMRRTVEGQGPGR